MAQIFPEWANKVPGRLAGGVAILALLAPAGIWYYFSPEFTDVGYRPRQPIPFSHQLHVGELRLDCRYCHATVEVSAVATVPPTQVCMNCHELVARDSDKLRALRRSIRSGEPIRWIRVHKVPDYAYFDHGVHVRAGIGCASCHGNVAEMEEIQQVEPLSMGWCLDCHRHPDPHLRPLEEVTNLAWKPSADQAAFARWVREERQIVAPTDCTACHR